MLDATTQKWFISTAVSLLRYTFMFLCSVYLLACGSFCV